ncbi:MAG: dienelactone hydrolase family protein [Candidatus Binataceae bacterium]
MAGATVSIRSAEGDFSGYLALPESGSGPGLIIPHEIFGVNHHIRWLADFYAQEGWVTLVPDLFWRIQPGIQLGFSEAEFQQALSLGNRLSVAHALTDIETAVNMLRARPECNGKVGAIGFCLGGKLAFLTAAGGSVDAAVGYYAIELETMLDKVKSINCPALFHFAGEDALCPEPVRERIRAAMAANENIESYVYPGAQHAFNNRERTIGYDKFASTFAHTRTVDFLRRAIGPRYDMAALWERHTHFEFRARDADETMKTMVADPYVNHIPTMTGGYGFEELHRYYKYHFIPKFPKDTKNIHVSRTVQGDRLIDEVVLCFTHDIVIDSMLPGIAPTGKYVEVPLVAIVQFRGDKLYNEHIYWDQASLLAQIGVIDPKQTPAVAGIETAKKVLDEKLPANTLMPNWKDSAGGA